jgi:hypothetical protein
MSERHDSAQQVHPDQQSHSVQEIRPNELNNKEVQLVMHDPGNTRELKIDQLFDLATNYVGLQSYTAQAINSHRMELKAANPNARLRLEALLQGLHMSGGLNDAQFNELAGLLIDSQFEN